MEYYRFNSNVIRCLSCGLRVKQSEMGMGDAAERWNRRAAQPGQEGELPNWWPDFIKGVCEIPDRSSPEGEPEAIIATPEELAACALSAIDADRAARAAPQPATADAVDAQKGST